MWLEPEFHYVFRRWWTNTPSEKSMGWGIGNTKAPRRDAVECSQEDRSKQLNIKNTLNCQHTHTHTHTHTLQCKYASMARHKYCSWCTCELFCLQWSRWNAKQQEKALACYWKSRFVCCVLFTTAQVHTRCNALGDLTMSLAVHHQIHPSYSHYGDCVNNFSLEFTTSWRDALLLSNNWTSVNSIVFVWSSYSALMSANDNQLSNCLIKHGHFLEKGTMEYHEVHLGVYLELKIQNVER